MADTPTITRSAQVETDLSQIRTAVYGREVREAIANGIEHCYDDNQAAIGNANEAITAANTAAGKANTATSNANTATTRANNAAAAAENVNATASKVQDGPYQITVTNSAGNSTTIEIPDPAAEVKKKANLEAVTVKKTVGPGDLLTFQDGVDAPAVLTKIKLKPKQDLHGYDHPWVGGAGKNKLPYPYSILSLESNGITWNVLSNGTITATGTATDNSQFTIFNRTTTAILLPLGDYLLNGCPSDGSSGRYEIAINTTIDDSNRIICHDYGSGASFTVSDASNNYGIYIIIRGGMTVSNLVFRPMIRLATAADDTYEPYSNICPIEGYDAVNVRDAAKNILDITELLNAPSGAIPGEAYAFTHLLKLPVKKNTQYTISTNYTYINGTNFNVLYFNTSKSSGLVNSAATRTANSGEDGVLYIGFVEREGYLEFVNGSARVQLEEGRSATEYVAYNGNTMSISLASAGTVYGGELTLNEDGSGTVVADWYGHAFDGTESWTCNRTGVPFFRTSAGPNGVYYPAYISNANTADDGATTSKCSHYTIATVTTTSKSTAKFYIYHSSSNVYPFIQFRPIDADAYSAFETSEEAGEAWIQRIKEWYNAGQPLTIAYKIQTPISYDLTATQIQTLVGTNHVWTDAGEITMTYRSDKYAELERRISQLEALVLES